MTVMIIKRAPASPKPMNGTSLILLVNWLSMSVALIDKIVWLYGLYLIITNSNDFNFLFSQERCCLLVERSLKTNSNKICQYVIYFDSDV